MISRPPVSFSRECRYLNGVVALSCLMRNDCALKLHFGKQPTIYCLFECKHLFFLVFGRALTNGCCTSSPPPSVLIRHRLWRRPGLPRPSPCPSRPWPTSPRPLRSSASPSSSSPWPAPALLVCVCFGVCVCLRVCVCYAHVQRVGLWSHRIGCCAHRYACWVFWWAQQSLRFAPGFEE